MAVCRGAAIPLLPYLWLPSTGMHLSTVPYSIDVTIPSAADVPTLSADTACQPYPCPATHPSGLVILRAAELLVARRFKDGRRRGRGHVNDLEYRHGVRTTCFRMTKPDHIGEKNTPCGRQRISGVARENRLRVLPTTVNSER